MTTTSLPIHVVPAVTAAFPDLGAIKTKQQATWASGDYAVIGATFQLVGETLAEAADVRAGEGCSTWPPATATAPLPPPGASPR